MGPQTNARAMSLVEVLVAAVMIGVSALPILELVRSGTARLEVTEIEVAARQLGSDVLERVAGPRSSSERGLTKIFQQALVGQGVRWKDLLANDASLRKEFPDKALGPLLELHEVRVRLEHKPGFPLPGHPTSDELEAWIVTVAWVDRNQEPKEVAFARLVDY